MWQNWADLPFSLQLRASEKTRKLTSKHKNRGWGLGFCGLRSVFVFFQCETSDFQVFGRKFDFRASRHRFSFSAQFPHARGHFRTISAPFPHSWGHFRTISSQFPHGFPHVRRDLRFSSAPEGNGAAQLKIWKTGRLQAKTAKRRHKGEAAGSRGPKGKLCENGSSRGKPRIRAAPRRKCGEVEPPGANMRKPSAVGHAVGNRTPRARTGKNECNRTP